MQSYARAWLSGDLAIATSEHERMAARYPTLTALIVNERNERWVPRILEMLDRQRSTFVCVGLGHLVGPHSIQECARRASLEVVRA